MPVALYNAGLAKKTSVDSTEFATEIYYYEEGQKIQLKNSLGDVISEIDASRFVVDGMIESVEIVDDNLVIHFNTDAGKEDITIPISDIFDADNYYTKFETDGAILDAIESLDLGSASTCNYADYMSGDSDNGHLPTKGAVKSYVSSLIAEVRSQIKDSTITISNGFPAGRSASFTLNQSENAEINLGLNAAAYRAVANTVTADNEALPTASAVVSYIDGRNFATVSQIPTVNNATVSIARNASDQNPCTFTMNQSAPASFDLGLADGAFKAVDTSIGSSSSSNVPTSDAVKSYVNGQGYAQISNLGAAAEKDVDTSIGSSASSNLPTTDAVKAYAYSKAEVDNYIANVVFNEDTKVLTFTRGDGSTFTVTLA